MTRRAAGLLAAAVVLASCSSGASFVSPSTSAPPTVDALVASLDLDAVALRPADKAITTHDLAALYRFDRHVDRITDRSGVARPEPLVVDDPTRVVWPGPAPMVLLLPGGSLSAAITSDPAVSFAGGTALELWIDPTRLPGQVARVDGDDGSELELRIERSGVRLTLVAETGAGPLGTADLGVDPGVVHVVVSTSADRSWLVVDGVERAVGEGLGRPPRPHRLELGAADGTWAGGVSLVAVYTRPLLAAEATQHLTAGPQALAGDGPELTNPGDVRVIAGESFIAEVGVHDPLGRAVQVAVTSDLAGLTWESTNDAIVIGGSPELNELGDHLVAVEVTAGERVAAITFLVTVLEGTATVELWADATTLTFEQKPLLLPTEIAAGASGVYVSDYAGNRIYRVGRGTLERVIGTGVSGYSGDGGRPDIASLFNPSGLVVAPDGRIIFADHSNHRIRELGTDGILRTLAGVGVPGDSGTGGPATDALLDSPEAVAIGLDGTIYATDFGNRRIVAIADGVLTTFAGNELAGRPTDGAYRTDIAIGSPSHLAVGLDGTVYFSDINNDQVWRIDPEGTVHLVAGSGVRGFTGDGGPAVTAWLAMPSGLALDSIGRLLIADGANRRIRRVDSHGTITTVAGSGELGWGRDGSLATLTGMHPDGIAFAADGRLMVVDQEAGVVAAIDGL